MYLGMMFPFISWATSVHSYAFSDFDSLDKNSLDSQWISVMMARVLSLELTFLIVSSFSIQFCLASALSRNSGCYLTVWDDEHSVSSMYWSSVLSLGLFFSLKICVKLQCCPIKWAYQLYDSVSQSATQMLWVHWVIKYIFQNYKGKLCLKFLKLSEKGDNHFWLESWNKMPEIREKIILYLVHQQTFRQANIYNKVYWKIYYQRLVLLERKTYFLSQAEEMNC